MCEEASAGVTCSVKSYLSRQVSGTSGFSWEGGPAEGSEVRRQLYLKQLFGDHTGVWSQKRHLGALQASASHVQCQGQSLPPDVAAGVRWDGERREGRCSKSMHLLPLSSCVTGSQ